MSDMFKDAQDAIDLGIEWLDENHPNWLEAIDTKSFHLGDINMCIMGQLGLVDDHSIAWMKEHGFWGVEGGFNWYMRDRDDDCICIYDLMTDMWLYEIKQRV